VGRPGEGDRTDLQISYGRSVDLRDLVEGYFSKDGKLHTWPSRKRHDLRRLILERLSERFEEVREYSEPEVNAILKSVLIFEDHVLIRRELSDGGFLGRTQDGRRYWKGERSVEAEC